MPRPSSAVPVMSMHCSGKEASERAERPRPHDPACDALDVPHTSCAPAVSSHTGNTGIDSACVCTSASATSNAKRGERARDACCVVAATAMIDQAPPLSLAASSARVDRDVSQSHPTNTSSSPITSTLNLLLASSTSSARHSVAYRSRCTGASARSTRDLKPSSCAWGGRASAPSRTDTASAL